MLYSLLGANVAVWGAWKYADTDWRTRQFMQRHFLMVPADVINRNKYHTLVTSLFSHKDGFHLLMNMVALYTFGIQTVATLGAVRFLSLYFGGGIFASLCYVAWPYLAPQSLRSSRFTPCLGASGAVESVVAFEILTAPTRTILIYFIPVPAAVAGVGFVAYSVYGIMDGSSNIAHVSHLGGALYGIAYFMLKRFRGRRFR